MLTGCDYDPTVCDPGPQWGTTALIAFGILLVAAILYEIGKSWWADHQKHKKPEYPPSWLD